RGQTTWFDHDAHAAAHDLYQLCFANLAHLELLDLAGDRHREFADEFDVLRNLEMGNLVLAVGTQRALVDFLAGVQLHPGDDLFAVLFIRYANHLDIGHGRMGIQEFFDFARVDIFTAADDHVLAAADDLDVSLSIHFRQV